MVASAESGARLSPHHNPRAGERRPFLLPSPVAREEGLPMSTADVELFGPPEEVDTEQPRFTTVLRGYDPEQVKSFVLHLASRIEGLERDVEEARSQRDAARRRYSMARDDAYGQLANRMADLLRTADQQADKIRREADDTSKRMVEEARKLATQIVREAEGEAERLRAQGQDALRQAVEQRHQVLGGLVESRDGMLADLGAARDHLSGIITQLETAMTVARSAEVDESLPEITEEQAQSQDPLADDLLGRTEAFEIMLPEFMTVVVEEPDSEGAEAESSREEGSAT
jgi:cell division septum initiation protein DivIVA